MSSGGDLEDYVTSLIERWFAQRHVERHALVTSFDPNKYLGKVALQPGGQETGWLPIETGHIGSTYGIVVGLQPGQAGVSSQGQGGSVGPQSQNQGDQVIVRFQEGDFESGKIVQRVHSDADTPPVVQSGEIIIYTRFQKSGGPTPDAAQGAQGGTGQQIYLKNDGSLTVTDGNGATISFDGRGNIDIACKTFKLGANNMQVDIAEIMTLIAQGNAGIKSGGNLELKGAGTAELDAGGVVVVQGGGDVADLQVETGSAPNIQPPFQVPPG